MNALTIEIADAVISAHQKQAAVRSACVVYYQAMLDLRASYFLDTDTTSWPEGLGARLELLNKERRKHRRTNLRSKQTALRKLLTIPARNTGNSVVVVSQESSDEPFPRQGDTTGKNAQMNSDLVVALNARVMAASERSARLQVLFRTFDDLYETRVRSRTISPEDRVSLRRARPRMQKGLDEAMKLEDTIKHVTSEWWPYIELLMCEVDLEAFLKTMHDMKIPFRAFLEKTTPVCKELAKLYATRDTIVQEGIKMTKYDHLLAQAEAQRSSHDAALLAVKELDDWASYPAVVPCPRGTDICIDRLLEADEKVRELHKAMNAMNKLVDPLLVSLEGHVAMLSDLSSADTPVGGQGVNA